MTKAQGFQKLERLGIIVENLDQNSRNMGLTEESLKNQPLVALKRDIPKLKIEPVLTPYIYIRVSSLPVVSASELRFGFASLVEVPLKRNIRIVGDDSLGPSLIIATVWDKGSIFNGAQLQFASAIHLEIDGDLKAFAFEYYRENP